IASGATGALLVSAVTARGRAGGPAPAADRPTRPRGVLGPATALLVAGTTGVLLGRVLVTAAREGQGAGDRLGDLVRDADGVVSHTVTVVLLDLRALDTLLEVAVLTAAVLAALALHRDGTLAHVPLHADPRPVVRGFAVLAVPLVLLLTGWFLVAGSSRPGGAFQSGAMLAGAALLLALTGRADLVPTGRLLRPAVVAGLATFLVVAGATRLLVGTWLRVEAPWGGWVVLGLEAGLVLSIGVGLTALVLAARPDSPADAPRAGASGRRGADS
ncbi:MnhB domain-containing protein, partial [Cellulomonas triticagri]